MPASRMNAQKKLKACQQQGAALIIALLILAIVVVITATMTVEHNFHVRRVSNQLAASQVYSILRGTEAFAFKALAVDNNLDIDNAKHVDNITEFWAGEKDFIFDEVLFRGELIDLQGRFNLNSLLAGHDRKKPIPNTNAQAIFIRFLQTFSLEGAAVERHLAQEITEAIIDYIDTDDDAVGFSCGEDSAYFSIEGRAPHRTANQYFYSVSELRLICNLPVDLYRQLASKVTVWPIPSAFSGIGITESINLNTASINLIQAVLIGTQQDYDNAKLGGDKYPLTPMFLSDDEQKEVQMAQGYLPREEGGIGLVSQGWATDEEAVSYFAENFNNALLWPTDKLVLGSEYFLLLSTGKLADVNVYLESVISRDNDTMKVIARSTGGL